MGRATPELNHERSPSWYRAAHKRSEFAFETTIDESVSARRFCGCLRKLDLLVNLNEWRESHATYLRFDCGNVVGYQCFGGATSEPAKFNRRFFNQGKRQDHLRAEWLLLSPRPTCRCPVGLWRRCFLWSLHWARELRQTWLAFRLVVVGPMVDSNQDFVC